MRSVHIPPPDLSAPALADAASAEAWDAWFRWRSGARLHDVVVADTWNRVGSALAAAVPGQTADAREFIDALQTLQVLPDPRVLAGAGGGDASWPAAGLTAAINLAPLVRDPFTHQARLDLPALARNAATAVRMLDAATMLAPGPRPAAPILRIGPIGCADALFMLRQRYDSDDARATVRQIAAAVALACWTESARLAAERGACAIPDRQRTRIAALSPDLDVDVARHGVRYAALTAVDPQAQLALLANNVADAVTPLRGEGHWIALHAPDGVRRVRSSGDTLARYGRLRATGAVPPMVVDTGATIAAHADAALLSAMEPWIDSAGAAAD